MKRFAILLSTIMITAAVISCGSSSDDKESGDPAALSGENLTITETVYTSINNAVDSALNGASVSKRKSVVKKGGEPETIDYSNDDGSLKITGTEENMTIVMNKFSTTSTDTSGTTHALILTGTITKTCAYEDNEEKTASTETTTAKGDIAVSFDSASHTIKEDLTKVCTSTSGSTLGYDPYTITGTVTFDGTEYSYSTEGKEEWEEK